MNKFVSIIPRGGNKKRKLDDEKKKNEDAYKSYNSKKDFKQMYLDLGQVIKIYSITSNKIKIYNIYQKDFDIKKQCDKCGMIYASGDIGDSESHKTFCNKVIFNYVLYCNPKVSL
jgi:hypothetical protein